MSKDKCYNGWTNYETWNLVLWLGNEEGSDSFWRERAESAYAEADADKNFSREEKATLELARELEEDIEANTPTVTGFYADILNAAIREVNWYEIAEHYIEDVDKDADDENA